ncbi:MAG TPA: serine hydrolase domain-containing protein [Anaerolineales bacterium]|nr:serine hydrolase domain-containing protein [Anaerolineales bacterium]
MKPDLFSSRPGAGTELLDRMHPQHGDKIPGVSIAVIDGGELAWAGGYGVLEARSNRLVTTDTLFQACSISKPDSALAALNCICSAIFVSFR